MKKFEIGKQSEQDKFNFWFSHCSEQQIPYVIIKNKTKYSSVEWDHINLKPAVDKILDMNGEENKSKIIKAFMKYADKKSKYTISNVILFATDIPVANATKFAEEVYDIIRSQLN